MEHFDKWEEAADERRANGQPEPWIPTISWGDALLILRRHMRTPRISQEALAAAIKPILRCSRRDISRLESSATMPDDARLKSIAMGMVAYCGADPIWAKTSLGLTPWGCGFELDQLASINQAWVDHVVELCTLIDARPPLWLAAGDR